MNKNGNVLPIQTLRKLRDDELSCELDIKEREDFDANIQRRHGTSLSLPKEPIPVEVEPVYESRCESEQGMPEADDIPDYDRYVNADVLLPKDGEYLQSTRVVRCVTDDIGNPIGNFHDNPLLDMKIYKVMFGDGSKQQFAANVIAENL